MKTLRWLWAAAVCFGLSAAGCEEVECGPGTRQEGSRCVPISMLTCGPDTREQDSRCVPISTLTCGINTHEETGACVAPPPITCGAGTSLQNGACVETTTGPTCGPGTVLRGTECRDAGLIHLHLPFASGTRVRLSQGMHGFATHSGAQVNAIDFAVPEGTMVVAAGPGRVVGVKEDSSTGCFDESCADQGNYVRIDEGDGTMVEYFHLQQNGALVALGDIVCAGQPIALSGNTGFSGGPHLHLGAIDLFAYTLPIFFEEIGDRTDGTIFEGIDVVSTNTAPTTCTIQPKYSDCPADTFAPFGVWLDPGLPCTLASRSMDYPVTGQIFGPSPNMLVGRYRADTQAWQYDCVTTAADGRFSTTVRFLQSDVQNRGYIMLLVSDRSCGFHAGFDASVAVQLR